MPRSAMADGLKVWEWPGDPPDTLLMHGIGNYARYWDFLAEEIAGRLRLVAYDARGHGDSKKPATGYAPDHFAADAVAVMDAMAMARPLVVGHSMGGFHATALTVLHPERVRALVLVDVGPRVEQEGSSRARRLSLGRPDRFPDEESALRSIRETSPGFSEDVYRNRLRWLLVPDGDGFVFRSSKDALAQILDTRDEGSWVWDRIGEIRCPVLLVRGKRSQSFSEATARDMLRALPDARLIELDARHNVSLDQPHLLADAIVSFAREVGQGVPFGV